LSKKISGDLFNIYNYKVVYDPENGFAFKKTLLFFQKPIIYYNIYFFKKNELSKYYIQISMH